MSKLSIYNDTDPNTLLEKITDHSDITQRLSQVGVRFERWPTLDTPIDQNETAEAIQSKILRFYSTSINKLKQEGGYITADVISLSSNHPEKATLRQKFLAEHTHSEDEVRFFVEGGGLFSLHLNNTVFVLLCEKGDLISVPAKTKHWFDMGSMPEFTCIRLFNNPDGWIADYTGAPIADKFPRLD